MAICATCGGEMTQYISCDPAVIRIGDTNHAPIRWGDEPCPWHESTQSRCHDCGTPPGGVHHPGCCVERCPACLGQALGCPCFNPLEDVDHF
jgi:hypothetical protein